MLLFLFIIFLVKLLGVYREYRLKQFFQPKELKLKEQTCINYLYIYKILRQNAKDLHQSNCCLYVTRVNLVSLSYLTYCFSVLYCPQAVCRFCCSVLDVFIAFSIDYRHERSCKFCYANCMIAYCKRNYLINSQVGVVRLCDANCIIVN